MISTRASSVPLLIICPPSQAPGLRIDTDNQPARTGTAVHAGGAQYFVTGLHDSAQQLADVHGVEDIDELEMLLAFMRQAIDSIRDNFPNAIVEQPISLKLADDVIVPGHPDLLSLFDDRVAVADYKSGWKQKDYYDQLRTYALLACEVYDKPNWTVSLVWLRDRSIDTKSGTRAELDPFKQSIIDAARRIDSSEYRVGEHCEFCPRSHSCPARTALERQSVRAIAGIDVDRLMAMPNLGEVYAGLKCIEQSCQAFRDALKMGVEQRGGEYISPDGAKFKQTEIKKRVLDPLKAWPVLATRLSQQAIADSMKISLSKIEDAVAETAGKGMKGKVKEQLANDLDAAGAITRHVEKRLQFTAPKN